MFSGLILILLAGGLFAGFNLTLKKQVVKTRASSDLVNIEIISPRADSKVLGITQFRAVANTDKALESLTSVVSTDGASSEPMEVSLIEAGKMAISGPWDSSKLSPGAHTLEVFLYDKSSGLEYLGSSKVSVTVVLP